MISVLLLGFVETVLPCDLLAWQAFSFTIILSSAFVAGREELSFFFRSVFYGYYPSTRACTHCAVSLATRFHFVI